MDDQNKNLILAMVLSSLVLVVWMILFAPDPSQVPEAPQGVETAQSIPPADAPTTSTAPGTEIAATPQAERVAIDTPSLDGSISLTGGRIDQLSLKQYDISLDKNSAEVTLLSPVSSDRPYYAVFGWVPGGNLAPDAVPTTDTVWSVESGTTLTPSSPLTLRWDSPAGLVFRRTVSVDDKFMFTVTQTVENPTAATARLAPFGMVARHGEPQDLSGFFIIHEGAIRRTDGELEEIDYDDIPRSGER